MFKGSGKNLQWLGRDHNHTAHNNTIIDSFNDNHAAFLANLRIGRDLHANVESIVANILKISFRNGHFKGEAFIDKPTAIRVGDVVLVELSEKSIGSDGKIFLKTIFLNKVFGERHVIKCKSCSQIFNTIEELSSHVEYTCTKNICRHCGANYERTNEQHHTSKACIAVRSPSIRKKKKKKKSGSQIVKPKVNAKNKTT